MEVQLNTLYVMTRGASVRQQSETLQVHLDGAVRLTVPIHQVESLAVFGGVHVTPPAMALCAERGAAVAFLTESGRLVARVDAPASGNVLLRREQFRKADDPAFAAGVARCLVAGKVQNGRNLLLRAGREADAEADRDALKWAVDRLADTLPLLEVEGSVDAVRGREGDAARNYFQAFGAAVKGDREAFTPDGRSRRPPRDRMNALLSFLYALLTHDCVAACQAAGLDPAVGFLHVDRPGRPGLALDLMEEFRPLV
jgi:CRISPR-associated protein Cas1